MHRSLKKWIKKLPELSKTRLKISKATENFNLTENEIENSAKLPKVNHLSCVLHLSSSPCKARKANIAVLAQSEWSCPHPSCLWSGWVMDSHPQGSGVLEDRASMYTAGAFRSNLGTGSHFFPALCSSVLRGKLQLILIFSKLPIPPARDTEPA